MSYTTTATIDGMMCGHCEAHVNEAIREKLGVKKVSSSHTKGTTTIVADHEFTLDDVKTALEGTGYDVLSVTAEQTEEGKGLFARFK